MDWQNREEVRILHSHLWRGQVVEVLEWGGRRLLRFDNHCVQSRMDLDDPIRLELPYSRHMMACLLLLDTPHRILMVGLGGGSLVKFLLHYFPACQTEVVECHGGILSLAREFFLLPTTKRLQVHIADGAEFIRQAVPPQGGYDLILVDAFDHRGMARSVYAQAFFAGIRRLLAPEGVMAVNLTRGEHELYKQMLGIIENHFSQSILRLPVKHSQNEIVFGCNRVKAWGDWTQPLLRAQRLPAGMALEFSDFLLRMSQPDPSGWRRWLGFG